MPKWIDERFCSLRILILRSNNFSGEITPSMCQLTSLQILDLSHNRLSGRIPTCLNNLTLLTTKILQEIHYVAVRPAFQESASIAAKGSELTYGSTLSLVTRVDLSNNILSGAIPSEVTSLVELSTLNLSRNNLTGSIPGNIGNMKQLETLDFSMNSLSGNIPGSITSMSFLNSLNLSYNHLTGRIPESTQIRGLNESSFIGNHLCGPPLEISCKNDRNSPGPTHMENRGQEGNKAEFDWFYVFLSLGYAVGLLVVLTTLFLKKKMEGNILRVLSEIVGQHLCVLCYQTEKAHASFGSELVMALPRHFSSIFFLHFSLFFFFLSFFLPKEHIPTSNPYNVTIFGASGFIEKYFIHEALKSPGAPNSPLKSLALRAAAHRGYLMLSSRILARTHLRRSPSSLPTSLIPKMTCPLVFQSTDEPTRVEVL
ncbi:receptor like protein 21 [Striga hermonthica]|uniref:Receptor like protein 21 n=1 Tax=Striga hermonthica TaxID=68872 RepID=A0A9N7N717_STRHE|nr:receptor like protein 21 [Striga hermonthica]